MNNKMVNYQDYFTNQNSTQNPVKNMNYNKCMYTPKENPASLYDTYQGFIRGNMFPDLYNQYKNPPFDIEPVNEQAQLLTYVDALSFARHDIGLYLDNFPEDREMLELYNQYRDEANRAINKYEENYGPLTVDSNATNKYPWTWNQSPWPWEN